MADLRKEHTWLITTSLVIIAGVAIGVILLFARSVLIPFVLAVFISLLVSPVLDLLVLRFRMPRALACLVTFLLVLVFIAVVCFLLTEAVQTIISTAGRYGDSFANLMDRSFSYMEKLGIVPKRGQIDEILREKIPGIVTNSFGTALDFLSSLFLVSIFAIFLLAGRNPHNVFQGVYADINTKVRRYILTKVAVSTVTGLLVWIVLSLFKLELAGVFGMFAFLLNFIPSVGSVVATLLPIPIAVAQFQNPWFIFMVVAVPGTIQMVAGNVIEPKLMGTGLNLHPVVILLALSFWGLLWGIVGMFLAVPITAVIRIVLMQFETLKPIGMLLAGKLPASETSPV